MMGRLVRVFDVHTSQLEPFAGYQLNWNTVNLEIFLRILFSQITLKDIFFTLKNRN